MSDEMTADQINYLREICMDVLLQKDDRKIGIVGKPLNWTKSCLKGAKIMPGEFCHNNGFMAVHVKKPRNAFSFAFPIVHFQC